MSSNNPISVPAHFDGERILLDEPVELARNARLVVTVLPAADPARDSWEALSSAQLNAAYISEGYDYQLESINEHNPDYEGS